MKKLASVFISAVFILSVLAGCGPKGETTDTGTENDIGGFAEAVELFAEVFVPMDNDGYVYSQAVTGVCEYLEGEKTWDEAVQMVTEAFDILYTDLENFEEKTLDQESQNILLEYGIVPEEFEAFMNYRTQDLNTYTENLDALYIQLQYVQLYGYDDNDLRFLATVDRLIDRCDRGLSYYANLNYWFAGISESQEEYLLQELRGQLKWIDLDDYAWENSGELIESKSMSYLDVTDEILSVFGEYYGMAESDSGNPEDIFTKLDRIEERYENIL